MSAGKEKEGPDGNGTSGGRLEPKPKGLGNGSREKTPFPW